MRTSLSFSRTPGSTGSFRGRDREAFPGAVGADRGGRGSDGLSGPGAGGGRKYPTGGLCERRALGRYGRVRTTRSKGAGMETGEV